MTEQSTPDILTELNALQAYFLDAKNQLAEGQIVDMTGMDARVSQLCQRVQGAAPADQQTFLPEMTILIDLLNGYEQELRRLQSSFANAGADDAS